MNVDRYGNTSSGSIPLALADAADDGRLEPGKLVLMTGMGAGLTWGSALIDWTHPTHWSDAHDARSHSCSPGRARSRPAWAGRSPRPIPRRWPSTTRGRAASGLDLTALCFAGSAERADRHRGAAAGARRDVASRINAALRSRGIAPDYVVGHSVGEFAALGAADVARRAARRSALVRERGLAMADAARQHPGSMAAILGLADEVVEALCKKIANVWPANYNCPGPARHLGRDGRGRRGLRRGRSAKARAARSGFASRARSTRRSSRTGGRAAAPGDRPDRTCARAERAFVSTVTAKLEDVAALRRAARRAADGAGAVHAGRARARRAGRDDVRRGRAGQRPERFTEEDRQLRAHVLGQRPGVARPRRGVACLTRRRSHRCRVEPPSSPVARAASAARSPLSSPRGRVGRRRLSVGARRGRVARRRDRRPGCAGRRVVAGRCASAWSTRQATSTCSSTTPG